MEFNECDQTELPLGIYDYTKACQERKLAGCILTVLSYWLISCTTSAYLCCMARQFCCKLALVMRMKLCQSSQRELLWRISVVNAMSRSVTLLLGLLSKDLKTGGTSEARNFVLGEKNAGSVMRYMSDWYLNHAVYGSTTSFEYIHKCPYAPFPTLVGQWQQTTCVLPKLRCANSHMRIFYGLGISDPVVYVPFAVAIAFYLRRCDKSFAITTALSHL